MKKKRINHFRFQQNGFLPALAPEKNTDSMKNYTLEGINSKIHPTCVCHHHHIFSHDNQHISKFFHMLPYQIDITPFY